MSTPTPFSEAWSLADTQDRLDQPDVPTKGSPAEQESWRQQVGCPATRKMAAAIGRHIAWMMQSGVPVVPPYCENVAVRVVSALKALQADPASDEAQREAGSHFAHKMEIDICFYPRKDETLVASEVHKKLLSVMEEGEFKFYPSDGGPCKLSGLPLYILFQGWHGMAATVWHEPAPAGSYFGKAHYTALTEGQVPAQGAETVSIPMPTGELLIADWFRIDAFHNLTNVIDNASDSDHDIGTVAGRATRTRRYADELGVAHVACRSPAILQDKGIIKAGYLDPDAKEPTSFKGSISADLRWTTLVDRGHLVDILTPALGLDEAKRQVAAYLKENSDIMKLQVEPGTHHLTFAGTSSFFQKTIGERFQAEGLYLEDFEEPAFVLTKDPLTPTPEVCIAQERKPPRP